MTPAERIAEMGAFLALGYRRLQIQRQNGLDGSGPASGDANSPVYGIESLGQVAAGSVPQSEKEIA